MLTAIQDVMGDYLTAKSILEDAIDMAKCFGMDESLVYVLMEYGTNLAMILTDTGDFDCAVTLSLDVLADFRARGDAYGIVGSASTLCGAYIGMGRYHDAMLLLKEWVKLAHDNQLITFVCGHDGKSKDTQHMADDYYAKLVTQLGNGEIQKLAKPITDIQDWITNLGL